MQQLSRKLILEYIGDFRDVLMAGSIGERRSFLRSFIETIEKSDSQVTINYTLPLPAEKVSIDHIGVLDIDLSGGPAWIRTHPPNYQPSSAASISRSP